MDLSAILMLQAVSAAPAVTPSATDNAPPTRIVCKAPAGMYEKVKLPGSSTFVATGRIRLLETRTHYKWAPAGGLLFKLIGKPTYVGVQAFLDPTHPGKLSIGLRRPLDDQPVVVKRVPRDSAVHVLARVDGRTLTVVVGDKSRSTKLPADVEPAAELMCSSGSFEFEF